MPIAFDRRTKYLFIDRGELAQSGWTPGNSPFSYYDIPGHVATPGTLNTIQYLHAKGLVVPPPLEMFDYDWPGEFTPYTAQVVTANMLVMNNVCYVLNEMRTGKTMSSLWAADFILRQHPGAKFLILSTLSTLTDVWRRSILRNFLGRRSCVVLHAHSAEQRLKRMDSKVDFYIANHDFLRIGAYYERVQHGASTRRVLRLGEPVQRLMARDDIIGVIIDEAGAFKEARTLRSMAGRALAQTVAYRWPMTGSPTAQAPTDIHGLRRLVEPDYIDRFENLRALLMEPSTQWRWRPKTTIAVRSPDGGMEVVSATEMAARMLRPAVRFRAVDCFDAPRQTIQGRRAERTPQQSKLFNALKQQALVELKKVGGDTTKIGAANASVFRMKALQILAGAVYDDDGTALKVDAAHRLNVLNELLDETEDKVIILAPFTAVLHVLCKHIAETYGHKSYVFIDGSVAQKDRQGLLDAFRFDQGVRFLIAQPEVLKFGLDLSCASIVIWYGPTDKTETWIQANQRVCGPNQVKPTLVACISAHSIEETIYKRLQENESLQDVFLSLIEEREFGE